MPRNNELFEFLKLDENDAQAKNINAVDRALGAQFAKMSPSQKTLDNIMAAAEKRNTPFVKRFSAWLSYRRVLAGAAIVFILALVPGLIFKQVSDNQEILAYAAQNSVNEITNLDDGINDVMSELDDMEGNI